MSIDPQTGHIAAGTQVTWSSHAAGSETLKTGTVRAFIKSGQKPINAYPGLRNISASCLRFDSKNASTLHPRYLVEVKRYSKTKAGVALLSYWYAPRATTKFMVQPDAS